MVENTEAQIKQLRERWKGHEEKLKALIPIIKADPKWEESEEYKALMSALYYNVPQKLDSDLRRIEDGFEEQKAWNVGIRHVQFRKGVYDEFTQAL